MTDSFLIKTLNKTHFDFLNNKVKTCLPYIYPNGPIQINCSNKILDSFLLFLSITGKIWSLGGQQYLPEGVDVDIYLCVCACLKVFIVTYPP